MSGAEHFQTDLRTERLLLRRLRQSDANFITTHASDFQVARNLAVVPHPYPQGAAAEFIAKSLRPEAAEMVWLIEYGPVGSEIPAGVISLRHTEPKVGILGYWVAPWLWGFGFASEAVAGLVAHAEHTGFRCLQATVHEGNAASARVLVKAGFERIGEGEEHSVALNESVHVGHFELNFDDKYRAKK